MQGICLQQAENGENHIFSKSISFNQNNWFTLNENKSIIYTQLKTKRLMVKIKYHTYSIAMNLGNMRETFEPKMGRFLSNIEAAQQNLFLKKNAFTFPGKLNLALTFTTSVTLLVIGGAGVIGVVVGVVVFEFDTKLASRAAPGLST